MLLSASCLYSTSAERETNSREVDSKSLKLLEGQIVLCDVVGN